MTLVHPTRRPSAYSPSSGEGLELLSLLAAALTTLCACRQDGVDPDYQESPVGTFRGRSRGNLTLSAGHRTDDLQVYSRDGDDSITTGSGDDTVRGLAGSDTIATGAGDDEILGGPGDDTILAGPGDDSLTGGAGDDVLLAGTGADAVHGDAGDDVVIVIGPGRSSPLPASFASRVPAGILREAETAPPEPGDVVDGGTGEDEVLALGRVSLRDVTLSRVERLSATEELTLDTRHFHTNGGHLESVTGLRSSLPLEATLYLESDGSQPDVDLRSIVLAGFSEIDVGTHVVLRAESSSQLLRTGVARIDGGGTVRVGVDIGSSSPEVLSLCSEEMRTPGAGATPPASSEQAVAALRDRLFELDPTELAPVTSEQRAILDWLAPHAGRAGLTITKANLPYVLLGAIRNIYCSASQAWTGPGLLDYLLQNPQARRWHTCAYLCDVYVDVLDAFGFDHRPLTHWRIESYTHATCEFFSPRLDDWVFVDVLYGAVFLDASGSPASFREVTRQMMEHGVEPAGLEEWSHTLVRFYGPFDTEAFPSPVALVESLDKRDYGEVVRLYFPVTALRYEDTLYEGRTTSPTPIAPEPIARPQSPYHHGRWLVVDVSGDPQVSQLRYGAGFWSWFDLRYHFEWGGSYSYDVLTLADGHARFDSRAPAADLEGVLEVGQGARVRLGPAAQPWIALFSYDAASE